MNKITPSAKIKDLANKDAAKAPNVVQTFNTDTNKMEAVGAAEPDAAELNLPVPAPIVATSSSTERDKKQYQMYKSAKASAKTISDIGTRIVFVGHKYVTKDKDTMAWLDAQIVKNGLPGITKAEGGLISIADQDPMEAIKRKHYEEFKAEELKKKVDAAAGIKQDMGNTKPEGDRLNAMSSESVAT